MSERKCGILYFPQKAMTPFDMLSKSAEGDESILQMCDINNNTEST